MILITLKWLKVPLEEPNLLEKEIIFWNKRQRIHWN